MAADMAAARLGPEAAAAGGAAGAEMLRGLTFYAVRPAPKAAVRAAPKVASGGTDGTPPAASNAAATRPMLLGNASAGRSAGAASKTCGGRVGAARSVAGAACSPAEAHAPEAAQMASVKDGALAKPRRSYYPRPPLLSTSAAGDGGRVSEVTAGGTGAGAVAGTAGASVGVGRAGGAGAVAVAGSGTGAGAFVGAGASSSGGAGSEGDGVAGAGAVGGAGSGGTSADAGSGAGAAEAAALDGDESSVDGDDLRDEAMLAAAFGESPSAPESEENRPQRRNRRASASPVVASASARRRGSTRGPAWRFRRRRGSVPAGRPPAQQGSRAAGAGSRAAIVESRLGRHRRGRPPACLQSRFWSRLWPQGLYIWAAQRGSRHSVTHGTGRCHARRRRRAC
mmetsp:Transcript_73069/g.236518  ORF Transcript_73069/g.236518 Transcript_73069/m.236518 type:complete len:396 (-) Transcript_73069:533-1720(-)